MKCKFQSLPQAGDLWEIAYQQKGLPVFLKNSRNIGMQDASKFFFKVVFQNCIWIYRRLQCETIFRSKLVEVLQNALFWIRNSSPLESLASISKRLATI